jgi:protein-S-isoprenylcysteine O-methyltransferase Ste14
MFRFRGWIGIAGLAAAVLLAWPLDPEPRTVLIAAPLVLGGVALRVWARSYFQRGSDTRRIRSQRLIVQGPYRFVRNPLYLGNLGIQAGLVAAYCGFPIGLGFAAFLWLTYHGVIRSEEKVLLHSHGDAYQSYLEHTPRWLPRLRAASPSGEVTRDVTRALRKESQRLAGVTCAYLAAVLWSLLA